MKRSALLFLLCSTASGLAQSNTDTPTPAITLTDATISRICVPNLTDYKAVPETEFLTTDPSACILLRYQHAHKGDKVRFEWRNPLGTVMKVYDGDQPEDGDRNWFISLPIRGEAPSFAPGDWHVRVTYNGAGIVDLPFHISIPPPGQLEFVSGTLLPQGTVGVLYDYRFTVRGGDGLYRWTVSDGLPKGLSLSTEGALAGIPSQRGGYRFVVTAQDESGNRVTRTIALGIGLSPEVRSPGHVLTTSRSATEACAQGDSIAIFERTQPEIWLGFVFTGGKASDVVATEWLNPNGDVAHRTFFTYKNTAESCFQQSFAIAKQAEVQPGSWRVRVIWNNREVLSVPFQIRSAAVTTLRDTGVLPGRLALLIGNTTYQHLPAIPSAVGDVEFIETALQHDGFDVMAKLNLNAEDWRKVERQFIGKVQKGSVVVVYYSGYGLHEGSENWLLPVTFDPSGNGPLSTKAYSVLRLRQLLEEKNVKLKIFFLNAARTAHGVESQMRKAGLAVPEVDSQTVVCLALPPGRTEPVQAHEKTSPFARMLAGVLGQSNISLEHLLNIELQKQVEAIPGASVPAIYMRNPEPFSFSPRNTVLEEAPERSAQPRAVVHGSDAAAISGAGQMSDPLARLSTSSNGPGSGGGIGSRGGGGFGAAPASGTGTFMGGRVSGPVPIVKEEPVYSEEARKAKLQGSVLVSVVVDEQGNPTDIKIRRSLGLGLDEKAIEAVQKWKFRPGMKDGHAVPVQAAVEVNFRLLDGPVSKNELPLVKKGYWSIGNTKFDLVSGTRGPSILKGSYDRLPKPPYAVSIQVSLDVDAQGHPRNVQVQAPPAFDGATISDIVREWTFAPAQQAGTSVAAHGNFVLLYQLTPAGVPGGVPYAPMPPPTEPASHAHQIRVAGDAEATELIKKVAPDYPPLAKQARVQGTVTFSATIARDGSVQEMNLISGHPLLVNAAREAVKQWLYKPTILNGEAVEVITTIDVNFTLSQ